MTSVKVILRAEKTKKSGEAPLYVRIIRNRRPKLRSLGLSLFPKHWDPDKERVKKSHPNSSRFNALIARKRAEFERLAVEVEEGTVSLSDRTLREAQLGELGQCFMAYLRKQGAEKEKLGNIGSARKRRIAARRMEVFAGATGRGVSFADLSARLMDEMGIFWITERGHKTATVASTFRVIRSAINQAIREGIFPKERNPFPDKRIRHAESRKDFLTAGQLKAVEDLEYQPGTTIWHVRNMFVFSCYAGGIRFSDAVTLEWESIRENILVFNQRKTSSQVSVLLVARAREVLDLYREGGNPAGRVFPLLREEKYAEGGWEAFNELSARNRNANKHLKTIGRDAGLPFPLKYHGSRHTFATLALKNGMRIEYVSRLLGHASINTTKAYAKIVNEDLENAMREFELRMG